jgi:glucose/arabinose dehydrogenase
MSLSGIFARIVALIGAAALLWRRLQGAAPKPAWGSAPVVPVAKPQGTISTLKMPTARGWTDGQLPVVAPGLKVNAFATGLKHPRWIHVLPNGDVLVAEATQVQGPVRSVFGYAMQATMRRAAALGVSANRITLLRDTDGDGIAEKCEIFMEGLNQPFGIDLAKCLVRIAHRFGDRFEWFNLARSLCHCFTLAGFSLVFAAREKGHRR